MNHRRLIAILAATLMTVLLFSPAAMAESLEGVIVLSAPLSRSSDLMDGMVRVYLSSLGDPTSLDVTVTGNYSVNGNTDMTLTDGDTVSIGFDQSTGQITMTMDGLTYAMGTEMRLRRHSAEGTSALSIAQAKRPSNYYPGDLQLLAVETSSGYSLYPIVHVYIEYYLYGVVPYEMSSSWPIEALKAQAVVARTYTRKRMERGKHAQAAVCMDPGCCQGWRSPESYLEEGGRETMWGWGADTVWTARGWHPGSHCPL